MLLLPGAVGRHRLHFTERAMDLFHSTHSVEVAEGFELPYAGSRSVQGRATSQLRALDLFKAFCSEAEAHRSRQAVVKARLPSPGQVMLVRMVLQGHVCLM